VDDREGDSPVFLSALVQPSLQENRGGNAVHELTALSRGDGSFTKAARRLHCRQSLIDELDLSSRSIGEPLSEAARTRSFAPLLATAIERQTDEKSLDAFVPCEPNELGDEPARVATAQRRAGMRDHAELVGHGQPHAHLSEIDGCHSHLAASML
jgi:hypothetical protein